MPWRLTSKTHHKQRPTPQYYLWLSDLFGRWIGHGRIYIGVLRTPFGSLGVWGCECTNVTVRCGQEQTKSHSAWLMGSFPVQRLVTCWIKQRSRPLVVSVVVVAAILVLSEERHRSTDDRASAILWQLRQVSHWAHGTQYSRYELRRMATLPSLVSLTRIIRQLPTDIYGIHYG
jgi:hypothetical protein